MKGAERKHSDFEENCAGKLKTLKLKRLCGSLWEIIDELMSFPNSKEILY